MGWSAPSCTAPHLPSWLFSFLFSIPTWQEVLRGQFPPGWSCVHVLFWARALDSSPGEHIPAFPLLLFFLAPSSHLVFLTSFLLSLLFLFFLFKNVFFLIFNWRVMTYNIVMVSAIHQHESAMGMHMSPPSWTPSHYYLFIYFFTFWPCCMACGILVPQPGIEPTSLALGAWSLSRRTTREFALLFLEFTPSTRHCTRHLSWAKGLLPSSPSSMLSLMGHGSQNETPEPRCQSPWCLLTMRFLTKERWPETPQVLLGAHLAQTPVAAWSWTPSSVQSTEVWWGVNCFYSWKCPHSRLLWFHPLGLSYLRRTWNIGLC